MILREQKAQGVLTLVICNLVWELKYTHQTSSIVVRSWQRNGTDNEFGKRKCHFQQKKIYLFKKPNSQSKYLLSFINSEQMAQTLGIPKLNNTMFLSKKYQRSKQLQSNVPNAMTKTLKLSCWAFKGKLQLCLGKSGIVSKLGRIYSCKSRREYNCQQNGL